jgi:deazaflavin-dependent oxidoreductase (nitroreductase family)
MPSIPYHPNAFQRNFQRLASTAPMAWLLVRLAPPLDRFTARISGGKVYLAAMLSGLPVVLLTTTGAKSGQPRRTPLVAVLDGEKVILIASNFGQAHNPAWYYNLRTHPRAEIEIAGQVYPYRASECEAGEREKYWQRAVHLYGGYAAYKQRAAGRRIPVMVLVPETME